MQKVWINVVLSLVILFSLNCTGEKSFTISGKISGAENDSILIQEMQERGLKDLATVQVDKSGNIYYTDT
ncbi:MAG: hypothetical protein HOG34_20345, partial [Bacteroidetes bacterium]|nr:hypothetical protein [Bacteroidota bacterium]